VDFEFQFSEEDVAGSKNDQGGTRRSINDN